MKALLFVVSISFLMLAACSSISVKTDYDTTVNFKDYRTYQWYKGKMGDAKDALARNPLVKKRVMFAVDKALLGKKIRLQDDGEADLTVVIFAGSKERMQVTSYGGAWGWRAPGWGAGGYTNVSYYDEANLVIDLFDTKQKMLVWRGIATGILDVPEDQERQQKMIDTVVQKIINEYPPK